MRDPLGWAFALALSTAIALIVYQEFFLEAAHWLGTK